MTDDLSDIERAAEAATPGPWRMGQLATYTGDGGPIRYFYRSGTETPYTRTPVRGCPGGADCDSDARFIALANPARLLALVSEVRGLRAKDDEFPETLRIIAHAAALDFGDELTLEGLLAGLRGLVESHDEMVEQIEKRGGASRAIK